RRRSGGLRNCGVTSAGIGCGRGWRSGGYRVGFRFTRGFKERSTVRTKTMHWVLAAAVLFGLQLLSVPKAAQAQESVIDELHIAVNEYWHYMHYLQFVEEIYQQAEQIAKQVAQINNQLQALR